MSLHIHSRALRYFDMIRRCGSISEAARRLHVSSSAVNRQLLQLEGEVGTPAGYKEVHLGLWFGYFGPAKMPSDMVSYLNTQLNQALKAPAVVEKFTGTGVEALGGRR